MLKIDVTGYGVQPNTTKLMGGINFTLHQAPPVVRPIMTLAIHNAVNRETQSGLVLINILKKKQRGSLEVGKVAGMVILNRNPLEVPPKQLKEITILEIIKGGKLIYSKMTHSCIPII